MIDTGDAIHGDGQGRATERTMRHWMTPAPHSVGSEQPLSAARRIMRESGASTLPVVANGKLVGILSERAIRLVHELRGVDLAVASAADVMTSFVLAFPEEPVRAVVARMAAQRLDAAVVVEADGVVGTFTSIGALDILARQLSTEG